MLVNNINFKNYQTCSTQKNGTNSNFKNTLIPPLANDTVSFSSKNKNKLGFSSQFLYKAQVKQLDENGEEKLVPAKITRLIPDDPEDVEAMKIINKKWCITEYGESITDDFTNPRNTDLTLAMEIDNNEQKLKDRILCLAKTSSRAANKARGYNDINLKYLQSSPVAEHGKNNKYKGAGEVLMYGICQHAKDLGFSDVTLYSSNNSFYNHLQMPKAPDLGHFYYVFKKDSLDRFIEKVASKYQINQD